MLPKDIEKAIQSVIAQDYLVFTLIVVNDGSTDNTAEVLQSSTGIVGAYKNAFGYIDGHYEMFLDSANAMAP